MKLLKWETEAQFTVATMTWLTVMEYLCHKCPWICSICRQHFVTRLTRRVPLVEQEQLTFRST